MSDVIKLLPDSVANQIAAGEVIQRPASVIKELVENAIDAQATSVQIILKDAGRTLIQIIDNGTGMTETDARLAFERHSTSKIRQADDLFSLHTMGFRGEALASIAAIAQVELRTRTHDAQLGTKLIINASKCESQEPDMCPAGSNFMIKNLFFNVPARRKFLKSNQVELSNIVKEFEKLALVNTGVEFTLMHNGNVMYKLSPGNLLQRIAALMGKNLETQLIPVNISTSIVRVHGYVGKPENARKRNALQYFFVNGRFMRHPYFHKAVLNCYEQLIPGDEQPNYFLVFEVDPQSIDVNIHPTKTEIKFENEAPIWQILAAGIKESLGRFNEVPSIDFDQQGAPSIPAYHDGINVAPPKIDVDKTYNPFKQDDSFRQSYKQHAVDWDQLYRNFEQKRTHADGTTHSNDASAPGDNFLTLQPGQDDATQQQEPQQVDMGITGSDFDSAVYAQLNGHYIVTPIKSGLMVIDQHRAHVAVLFARYIQQITKHSITSQSILFPEVLHLDSAQNVMMCSLVNDLEEIGFVISQLGNNDWAVTAIPSGIEGTNANDIILQVINSIDDGGTPLKNRIIEQITLKIANAAAIPYGRRLSQQEMDLLTAELLSLPNPNYTPDGRTVMVVIPNDHISKLF